MSVPNWLSTVVQARAGNRCDYCLMSQLLQCATLHVEHIIPITCGGTSDEGNLALACPSCNLHKSDRSHFTDPESKEAVTLFHPRDQLWADHFAWQGTTISPMTATGRATVAALNLNHPRRQRIRDAEAMFGLFPPEQTE